jgi:hypothetical protein
MAIPDRPIIATFPRAEQIIEILREQAVAEAAPLVSAAIEDIREQLWSVDADGALRAFSQTLREQWARQIGDHDLTLYQLLAELLDVLTADLERHATRH